MTKLTKKQPPAKANQSKIFFLTLLSCISLALILPFTIEKVFAGEGETAPVLNEALIEQVKSKIDALPEAENITIENAAVVTSQIQEIDQIKFDLTDADYEELIRRTDGWSGGEYGERPAKYFAACNKLIELQGSSGSLAVAKKILNNFGMDLETEMLDLSKIKISFNLQKIDENGNDIGAPISLSMYGMPHDYSTTMLNELDPETGTTAPFKQAITPMASSTFYSRLESNAWETVFALPAGKYRIVEDTTEPMVINGKSYKTATTTYSYNGTTTTDGAIIEVSEYDPTKDNCVPLLLTNAVSPILFDQGAYVLSGTQGQTLGDVTFPSDFPKPIIEGADGEQVTVEGDWTWENGDAMLNAAGENQYTAIFTPTDASYLDDSAYKWEGVGEVLDYTMVRIPLTVNVKAKITFEQGDNILTGTQGQTLDDVTFPESFSKPTTLDSQQIEGAWTWENGDAMLNATGENQYTAIFKPTNTDYLDENTFDWSSVGEIADGAVRILLKLNVSATPPKLYIYINAVNAD